MTPTIKRLALATAVMMTVGSLPLWGMTPDDLIRKTGIAGGLCSFPHAGQADKDLALALAERPTFVVHAMAADARTASDLTVAGERAGVLGRSLYTEDGVPAPLPYADRLVDVMVVTDLCDTNLTPALKAEWLRVLTPHRGVALVGRAMTPTVDRNVPALTEAALKAWIKDVPLAKVVSDDTGLWVTLRSEMPAGSDAWTHRNHGAENAQVSSDTTFKAPFLTQWWGLPRQEGFWGTTVVSCNGRMFSIRGSRNSRDKVSITARSLNNGIVLWQKGLRQAPETNNVPHGGYIPGRSCAVATDDSLFLVSSDSIARLNAETGEQREIYAGPKPAGQVKWIACSGNLLAVMAGDPDVVVPIAYQTVSSNSFGRDLAVYDIDRKKALWRETMAGDIDERLLAVRDNKLYCLVQGVGMVCRDLKTGGEIWANPDADIQTTFKTPSLKATGQFLVSLPVLSALDDVLILRAKWATNTVALSSKDGALLWRKPTVGGSYRGLTAFAAGNVWVGSGAPVDLLTGAATKGPRFISSGCGPTTYTPGYLITCFGKVSDATSDKVIRGEDIKSPCDVGTIVSEGTMVTVPSECGCYFEVKGYRALVSAGSITPNTAPDWKTRLTTVDAKDPAALEIAASDWPTYRHDPARSAASPVTVGAVSNILWRWKPSGAVSFTNAYVFSEGKYLKPDSLATAPVAVGGRVWFAAPDGIVHCLDAATGKEQWTFATAGLVFASPTIADGRVYVGGGDGRVYCLDATTGCCLWQFLAAPADRRLFWYGHLINTWPVVPGVVVQNGVAYTVAGYQKDNGIHAYALNAKTGKVIWEKDDAARGTSGTMDGLESIGNIAVGAGKMWVCGSPAGYFALTNGDWKTAAGGRFGAEIALMDKWVLRGGRRLSETQDTLSHPLGGTDFGAISDETQPQSVTLTSPGTCLPAWDAELTVMPPTKQAGGLNALTNASLLAWLSERPAAESALKKATADAKPKLMEWPDLASWKTENLSLAAFVLAKDQAVAANSSGRAHTVSGYSRTDGQKLWTATLPEQPAMNRMALDRDGRVLVALCDGSVVCLGR